MPKGKWLTPDTTGDSNIARCLSVPENLQQMVNYALQTLTYADNWEAFGTLTPQECADAFKDVLAAYYESEDCSMPNTPRNDFIFWKQGKELAGNPLLTTLLATQEFNTVWNQSAAALNDEMEFAVMLEQGTYDLAILARKTNASGVQHWIIDSVEDAQTIDCYSASTVLNFVSTISIAVLFSGEHSIVCKMSSKNAASASYVNQMTYFKLTRTGD